MRKINHPAEESATNDPAALGHELTRLRMEKTILQSKRKAIAQIADEVDSLYNEHLENRNQCYLRVDCNLRLLEAKLRNVEILLHNQL